MARRLIECPRIIAAFVAALEFPKLLGDVEASLFPMNNSNVEDEDLATIQR